MSLIANTFGLTSNIYLPNPSDWRRLAVFAIFDGMFKTKFQTMQLINHVLQPRMGRTQGESIMGHDDVIKWKHFPLYWPFVREIQRSTVNFPHKGQWGGALMFTLICARMNGWVNNREAGDLRRYWVHYDVIVMNYVSKGIMLHNPITSAPG